MGRKHHLPTTPVIALLRDAMPRPGLPLVHFNDTRCGSVAELRSVILKARRLAHDDAERERVATAVKTWLFAQIEKKQAVTAADIGEGAPDEPFASERLAASRLSVGFQKKAGSKSFRHFRSHTMREETGSTTYWGGALSHRSLMLLTEQVLLRLPERPPHPHGSSPPPSRRS
jgi:hypothetical protein